MIKRIKFFIIPILFQFFLFGQSDTNRAQIPQPNNASDEAEISLDSLLNIKISSASKYLETTKEAPSSVSIITSEDIEKYGYRSFPEIYNSIRGFYISYDRNYSYLGVRGFSRPTDYNDRIHLTINGHSVNDQYYGQASVGNDFVVPLSSIDRIEIIRGPGSVLYGNNAMFAVINIVTKTGKSSDHAIVTLESGSEGKNKATFSYGKELAEDFNFFASGMIADIKGRDLYYQEYDNPATHDGIAQNLDWEKYFGLYANASYKHFSFQGLYGIRQKGIPTGAYGTKFNDPSAKTVDPMGFLEIKYISELSADKILSVRGYFDHYSYRGTYPYQEDATTYLLAKDHNNNNWIGTEVLLQWDISTSNRLISGVELKSILDDTYENDYGSVKTTVHNYTFNTFSAFFQDEIQLNDNLTCNLGVRIDKQTNVQSILAPRAAAVYCPTRKTTVKLLYGQSFRYPNSNELYYEDAISRFKPSVNLKNEKIISNEFIIEHELNTWLYGVVSVYNNKVNDLIDQVSDKSDTSVQFQNIRGVTTTGADIEANTIFENGLSGFLRYSYQYSYDLETNVKLTNSPSHLIKCGFSVPFLTMLRLSAEGLYETERLTLLGEKTQPILLLNVNLSAKLFSNKMRVSLHVTNLLNNTYFYPGGYEHLQDVIAQDPRTFNLKISYDF